MSSSSDYVINKKFNSRESILNGTEIDSLFDSLVPEHFGKHVSYEKVKGKTLRVRENSCLIRCKVLCNDHERRKKFVWPIIGKVFRTKRGERVYANMQSLWHHGFSKGGNDGVSIPEPYYFSSELFLLLQEEIPGKRVVELLKKNADPYYLRRFAQCLVKLHSCPINLDNVFKFSDLLLRVTPKITYFKSYFSDLGESIDYINEAAQEYERKLQPIKLCPIHGDLHLGQVHLYGDKAWLLDIDRLSYGEPAYDLAKILNILRGIVHNVPNNSELIRAFFEQYFSVMDLRITKRILLYESLISLNRAFQYLRFFKLGIISEVRQMVQDRRFVPLIRRLTFRNKWKRRLRHLIQHSVECLDLVSNNGNTEHFWVNSNKLKIANLYLDKND